jgi:hypothetical protein
MLYFNKSFLIFCLSYILGNSAVNACNDSAESLNSGIEGLVTLSPTCPMVINDVDCSDRPYRATIDVLNAHNEIVGEIQSDTSGHFQKYLQPGTYILRPESSVSPPYAAEQTVTVKENQMTKVTINYDSGIRYFRSARLVARSTN